MKFKRNCKLVVREREGEKGIQARLNVPFPEGKFIFLLYFICFFVVIYSFVLISFLFFSFLFFFFFSLSFLLFFLILYFIL